MRSRDDLYDMPQETRIEIRPRKATRGSKRASKAPITQQLRNYGLPENLARYGAKILRYKHPLEKGVYWYFFSLFIRRRDVEKWGTCISCGRPITVETSDAGHFMPAQSCGRDLLFDEKNVNAECEACNAWDDTHLLGYAENLDRRYGIGTALELRQRRDAYKAGPPVKDWKKDEYVEKIMNLRKNVL